MPIKLALGCLWVLSVSFRADALASEPAQALRSLAVFYAVNPPVPELAQFDDVVLEPAHQHGRKIQQLQALGSTVFAYISVGEISQARIRQERLPASWFIADNRAWRSRVADLRSSEWQQWLMLRIRKLTELGYDGLFLDTLDSYRLGEGDHQAQLEALQQVLQQIRAQHPSLKLYFNRGFELLEHSIENVHAVAAESLFQSWLPDERRYKAVDEEDRLWLLGRLRAVQQRGVPVSVIDYVPARQLALREQTGRNIEALGFTPWISVPEQNQLGTGLVDVIKRRVLVVYDSSNSQLAYHPAHALLGHAYDYLGLRADYHDLKQGVPAVHSAGLYAGIVSFLEDASLRHFTAYEDWLLEQISSHTPVVFFQSFPHRSRELLEMLELQAATTVNGPIQTIRAESTLIGFEMPPTESVQDASLVPANADRQRAQLLIENSSGQSFAPVMVAPWGGLALAPFTYVNQSPGRQSWMMDPVAFLSRALSVAELPVPDSTTENGRRILLSHIDGDGFANRAEFSGRPFAAEVSYEKLLKTIKLPHTVSVVAGDIHNELPDAPELANIARRIFALPHVEAASHSYSHPFLWQHSGKASDGPLRAGMGAWPYPGRPVDVDREIRQSVEYINSALLPEHKQVEVMLWTGYAIPGDDAIKLTKQLNLANLNGGDTRLTHAFASTTGISPQLRPTASGVQIYAPVTNENMYTNEWQGPFYGYRKVIETFELTDLPRRHKPMSIYWHFYSGSKQASLNALREVYQWSQAQPHTAMHISEFSPRVEGSYTAGLARRRDGSLQLSGLGALRTLRVSRQLGTPDVQRSEGLAGYIDLPQGRYLHLSGPKARLVFGDADVNARAYLEQANGMLKYWQADEQGTRFQLGGHEALQLAVRSKMPCTLQMASGSVSEASRHGRVQFNLSIRDTGDALLVCR